MLKNLIAFSLLLSPFSIAFADNTDTNGINVGLGLVTKSGVYVGEDSTFTPIPTFSYEGERFFLRGIYGGAHLFKNNSINVNAILSANLESLDVDDLKQSKLAKYNLTRNQLEDRDMSADAGLELTWKGTYGILDVQALRDIGNASDAESIRANYQYFWRLDNNWTIIPNFGATWLSNSRANYYYGTLDKEVAKGVKSYHPGSVVIPHISIGASYNINKNWRSSAVITHKFFPSKISDSPIIDKDNQTSFFIGISRKF